MTTCCDASSVTSSVSAAAPRAAPSARSRRRPPSRSAISARSSAARRKPPRSCSPRSAARWRLPLSQVLIDVSSRMAETEGLAPTVSLPVPSGDVVVRPPPPDQSTRHGGSHPFSDLDSRLALDGRSTPRRAGPAVVSVWLGDLDGRPRFAHARSTPHYAASTMKLPLVIAALRRVGAASSTSTRRSRSQDVRLRPTTGRPFALDEAEDQDPGRGRRSSTAHPLARCELADQAITHSGNLATNLLLDAVGLARGRARSSASSAARRRRASNAASRTPPPARPASPTP